MLPSIFPWLYVENSKNADFRGHTFILTAPKKYCLSKRFQNFNIFWSGTVCFLIPGQTETRNVYSRICRNKTGNCCLSVFASVGQCYESCNDEPQPCISTNIIDTKTMIKKTCLTFITV